ncbi:protein of unknown function (plasmid) [Shinella sp. WSC3-e]|nr:protein of unknown function [Shinella sp. WSC3-e]
MVVMKDSLLCWWLSFSYDDEDAAPIEARMLEVLADARKPQETSRLGLFKVCYLARWASR